MKSKEVKSSNPISDYLLSIFGPLTGIILTTSPMLVSLSFVDYIILVGEVYLGVIAFVAILFIFTWFIMALMTVFPIVGKILFSKKAKHDYRDDYTD